jgi:hypothetical protein
MANYTIGRKRRGVTWSNNVIEGNGRLVFKGDFEFAMDRVIGGDPGMAKVAPSTSSKLSESDCRALQDLAFFRQFVTVV